MKVVVLRIDKHRTICQEVRPTVQRRAMNEVVVKNEEGLSVDPDLVQIIGEDVVPNHVVPIGRIICLNQ